MLFVIVLFFYFSGGEKGEEMRGATLLLVCMGLIKPMYARFLYVIDEQLPLRRNAASVDGNQTNNTLVIIIIAWDRMQQATERYCLPNHIVIQLLQ